MYKNEDGYIVVETIGTFIPFVLLIVSILSLVNIVSSQARIHHALTQTAQTLSMYSYVLKATGVSEDLVSIDSKSNALEENIGAVINGITSLSIGDADLNFEISHTDIINYGVNSLRNLTSSNLVLPLLLRYLSGLNVSGEIYLDNVDILDLYLTKAVIIDRNENVVLTVQYEIDYVFGSLRIPFGPKLSVTQTVVTKAWLGGSGEGYW